jgi:glyoxylase-like metal-dependent hydrolase (beta-lactamase superfamily II)
VETPRPPATAEFGYVENGGSAHHYPAAGALRVTKFSVGPYDNNVYVLAAGDEAFVIDGATDPERILQEVAGLRVIGILQTHNHHDHVQALPTLVRELEAPVYAHPSDPMPVRTEPLQGGEVLRLGGVDVRVVHTPGHTPGSTCYIADGFLFSGDTLFPGGPGNTFGNRKAFATIMRSLDELLTLDDDTRVLPGHGIDTRIGLERPHVRTWHERGW